MQAKTTSALADRIEAVGSPLAAWALAKMYEDPFWEARFGARGTTHARQDGDYHVRYLVGALRDGSPATLNDYARWLQAVLTTRGMCTLHLDDHFAWLARSLDEHGVADAATAKAYLDEARSALRYPAGPGRALQLAAARLVERASGAGLPARELEHLVSYLADAVALARPPLFVAHVRFLTTAPERRPAVLATLAALATALEAVDDVEAATAARATIDDASEELGAEVA